MNLFSFKKKDWGKDQNDLHTSKNETRRLQEGSGGSGILLS